MSVRAFQLSFNTGVWKQNNVSSSAVENGWYQKSLLLMRTPSTALGVTLVSVRAFRMSFKTGVREHKTMSVRAQSRTGRINRRSCLEKNPSTELAVTIVIMSSVSDFAQNKLY